MITPLKETRTLRGWSVARLQAELRTAAERVKIVLPGADSLRVMISRWENGRATPDATYQALLQMVYGVPAEALCFAGSSSLDNHDVITTSPTNHTRLPGQRPITPTFREYLHDQLVQHARVDNLLGPSLLLNTVNAQVAQLDALITNASDTSVHDYVLAARFNEFAGWLLQDSGRYDQALAATNRAVDFAQLSGVHEVVAYCLMRKSNVLYTAGQPDASLLTARQATQLATSTASELLAVCYRQGALSAALNGQLSESESALDHALTLAAEQAPSNLDEYCTRPYVEMEAGLFWISLAKSDRAIRVCRSALQDWPEAYVRDRSLCSARLALALSMQMELEEACQVTSEAVSLIEQAPSARAIQTIKQAGHRLAPYKQSRYVRAVMQDLARVV